MNTDWKTAFEKMRDYSLTLERERANLWGVNEELREKVAALEKGQEDIQLKLVAEGKVPYPNGVPPRVSAVPPLKMGDTVLILSGKLLGKAAVVDGINGNWYTVIRREFEEHIFHRDEIDRIDLDKYPVQAEEGDSSETMSRDTRL